MGFARSCITVLTKLPDLRSPFERSVPIGALHHRSSGIGTFGAPKGVWSRLRVALHRMSRSSAFVPRQSVLKERQGCRIALSGEPNPRKGNNHCSMAPLGIGVSMPYFIGRSFLGMW